MGMAGLRTKLKDMQRERKKKRHSWRLGRKIMSSFSHLKGEFKWQRKPGCWSLAWGDLLINTLSVCLKERHTLFYYLSQRARQKASQEAGADVNFSGGENEEVRFFSSKLLKTKHWFWGWRDLKAHSWLGLWRTNRWDTDSSEVLGRVRDILVLPYEHARGFSNFSGMLLVTGEAVEGQEALSICEALLLQK